jgi:hypothetical protein
MTDPRLRHELDTVSRRYRRLLLRAGLAACWLVLALVGLAVLARARGVGPAIPGIVLLLALALPLVLAVFVLRGLRTVRDPVWVARRLEQKFP